MFQGKGLAIVGGKFGFFAALLEILFGPCDCKSLLVKKILNL